MDSRGFGMVWRDPKGFADHMAKVDAESGTLMKATGLVR
jgi:hypothetical protein